MVHTIYNILECFSVDRYVAVNSHKEFEDVAFDLNQKKLYFAGIYFNETNNENDIAYSIRMDIDNTPVTVENRNRFWFPGAEGRFELDLRYHRGFIQIQHSVDTAIIRYQTNNHTKEPEIVTTPAPKDEFADFDVDFGDEDYNEETESTIASTTLSSSTEITTNETVIDTTTEYSSNDTDDTEDSTNIPKIVDIIKETLNVSDSDLVFSNGTAVVSLEGLLKDYAESHHDESVNRTRRQVVTIPQEASGLLSIFAHKTNKTEKHYAIDDEIVYTKQFPYGKYVKDEYVYILLTDSNLKTFIDFINFYSVLNSAFIWDKLYRLHFLWPYLCKLHLLFVIESG